MASVGAESGRTDFVREPRRSAALEIGSRRGAMVVLQQAAERSLAAKLGCRRHVVGRRGQLVERRVAEALMRSFGEKMADVLGDKVIQVPLAEDDEVVKALDLNRLHPSFDERIQVRRTVSDAVSLDPVASQLLVERLSELAVPIVEDELRFQAYARSVAHEVNRPRPAPFLGRVGGGRSHVNPSRADKDEGQHEEFTHTGQGQHLFRKEVTLPERLGVDHEELVPGLLTALGAGIEAVLAHDIDHELSRHGPARQLSELAENAGVTPPRLPRDHDHQVAQRHERLAAALRRFAVALLVAEPAAEGARRDNRVANRPSGTSPPAG